MESGLDPASLSASGARSIMLRASVGNRPCGANEPADYSSARVKQRNPISSSSVLLCVIRSSSNRMAATQHG
jgi:hypothetical protein